MVKKKKELNFGESLNRIEEIVEGLESGEMDLDKGVAEYEEGMKLIHQCRGRLKKIGNKVEVVREKFTMKE